MTSNPFVSAFLAVAYIASVASLMYFGTHVLAFEEPSVFIPIAILSLLVFSVAVMAYLFFYQPLLLLLNGEREAAARLFLRILAAFAFFTLTLLGGAFLVRG